MHRPGVMAPPDLYERQPAVGLMTPSGSRAAPVDVRVFLWSIAVVLASLELYLTLAPG